MTVFANQKKCAITYIVADKFAWCLFSFFFIKLKNSKIRGVECGKLRKRVAWEGSERGKWLHLISLFHISEEVEYCKILKKYLQTQKMSMVNSFGVSTLEHYEKYR